MADIFYEESSLCINDKGEKRKYTIFRVLSIISYVIAVLCVFLYFFNDIQIFNNVITIIISFLPLIVFIASGILFGVLKNKFHIDYDYTIVEREIKFSKVIMNKKRKLLYKFDTSRIEKIGKYGSETFEKYEKTPNIKKLFLTSNETPFEGKDFFYIVVNIDDTRILFILECYEKFMAFVLKYSNKFILEKDYK